MGSDSNTPGTAQLLHDLQTSEELKHRNITASGLDPHLALLRTWQSERLARTYADLLEDSRYRPACLFFLSDLYAPRDFSQRNHDVERIHAFLARVVPPHMFQLLTDVIELNRLTDSLDSQLVRVLVDKLGVTDAITPELYAEAYRICDNYAVRVKQLALISRTVEQVEQGAHRRAVGLALKLLRGPAHQAGWVELYDFLDHGYRAFRQMHDIQTFVDTIQQREKRILDKIFSGQPAF